jgi:hypothetical protein
MKGSGRVLYKASASLSEENSCVICDPFLKNMEGALCVRLEVKRRKSCPFVAVW